MKRRVDNDDYHFHTLSPALIKILSDSEKCNTTILLYIFRFILLMCTENVRKTQEIPNIINNIIQVLISFLIRTHINGTTCFVAQS